MSNVIVHETPGNELYPDPIGKLCPECKKIYVNCSADMAAHLSVCRQGWIDGRYGQELKLATEDPTLAQAVKRCGKVRLQMGKRYYEVTLSGDRVWLKRREVQG